MSADETRYINAKQMPSEHIRVSRTGRCRVGGLAGRVGSGQFYDGSGLEVDGSVDC
jgi:hypothetical protein